MISRIYMVPFRDLAMLSLITLGFGLLVARAVYLQVTVTEDLQAEGKARYLRNETIPANRGLIKDRNGEILAISTAVDSAWADPKILSKHADRWADLAKEVQISETQIRQDVEKYNSQNRQFMYLKRHLSPQQAKRVQELKVPGVSLMREYRRYYPHGSTAANLIGFTNIDDIGLEGIELSMNHQLEGKSGQNLVIKDRNGRAIETLAHTKRVQDGEDVHLSIDFKNSTNSLHRTTGGGRQRTRYAGYQRGRRHLHRRNPGYRCCTEFQSERRERPKADSKFCSNRCL